MTLIIQGFGFGLTFQPSKPAFRAVSRSDMIDLPNYNLSN